LSSRGALVVVSGPSGVGKTTVVAELLKLPGVTRSISATTRPPRGQEADGRDYFFWTRERFEEGVKRGEFLEHATINGQRYGTPRGPLEEQVAAGRVVILAIDVQGAATLRGMRTPFVGVFLMPPSVEELKARLLGRKDTAPEEARRRLERAMEEMKRAGEYDHVVTNVTVAGTVEAIVKILRDRGVLKAV
jgi:guanylate kinase